MIGDREVIGREINPDDRRSFVIKLTREGRRLADRIQKIVEQLEQLLGRVVSANDVKGFAAVMAAKPVRRVVAEWI